MQIARSAKRSTVDCGNILVSSADHIRTLQPRRQVLIRVGRKVLSGMRPMEHGCRFAAEDENSTAILVYFLDELSAVAYSSNRSTWRRDANKTSQERNSKAPNPPPAPRRAEADCGDSGCGGRLAGQAPRVPRPARHPPPIHLPRHVRRPRHQSDGVGGGHFQESASEVHYGKTRQGHSPAQGSIRVRIEGFLVLPRTDIQTELGTEASRRWTATMIPRAGILLGRVGDRTGGDCSLRNCGTEGFVRCLGSAAGSIRTSSTCRSALTSSNLSVDDCANLLASTASSKAVFAGDLKSPAVSTDKRSI